MNDHVAGLESPIPIKKSFISTPLGEQLISQMNREVYQSAVDWYFSRLRPSVQLSIIADYLAFKAAHLEEQNQ